MERLFKTPKSNLYKIIFVGILVLISIFLTFYFNLFFKTNIIFSHFFYLPISLSILWWKKRGLITVCILSIILVILPIITNRLNWAALLDNIIRALFFIMVGIVLTIVSEKLTDSENKLKERIKELDCLYEISKILCEPINTVDDIINGIIGSVSKGFQYPEDLVCVINFYGKEYKSKDTQKTEWKISDQEKIYDETLNIELYYLEEHKFLKEEIDLLKDIMQQIKAVFEFKLEYL